jgi:glycosyltransferase 2 family protein
MGRIRSTLTWLIAAGCLAWVMHDVDAAAFGLGLHGIRWNWVVAGLLFDVLSYIGQGWRWQLLLGGLSTRKATQAVYAGLFANEVLPLRLGEAVRAWLARRWTGFSLRTVIGSMATERLFDGVWLAGGIALGSQWVALPAAWAEAGRWLALATSLGAFALLLWRRRLRVAGAFGVSALVLLTQALAFASIARACVIPLPLWKAALALLVVRAGTAIPNAPANVGAYQFFTVLGLTWFGVAKAQASVFSIVVFVLLTLPLWLLGFLALRSAGYSLRQIRQEMSLAA